MSYEIPQQLEYKEKIIFGLTFKQLIYLFIFLPPIAFIFFKTDWHLVLKLVLCTKLMALGVGFVFLNLDMHLKNWLFWYKHKKIEKISKLKRFIPIEEIKDNIIFTLDNKKLAVLRIDPINFSIKPEEAKEAITASFQKFLNSLDFPVQIIMTTETLNLNDYFKELEKKAGNSERFKILFKDYKDYLESITKQNNVMNRSFYLIIPEKADINIQLEICQGKLISMGLKSYRLKNNELSLLIKNFFDSKEGFYPLRIENYSSYIKVIREEEILDEV